MPDNKPTLAQQLEEAHATIAGLTAQVGELGKANTDLAAKATAVMAERDAAIAATDKAVRERDAAIAEGKAAVAAEKTRADASEAAHNATKAELAAAKETLAGKNFAHVGGVPADKAKTAASGGGADDTASKAEYKDKAEALAAYRAITDAGAQQAFRARHWRVLGLPRPKGA